MSRRVIYQVLAHVFLIIFCLAVFLPFAMVIVASFRKGNLPPNTLWLSSDQWSLEHWKYLLGVPYQEISNANTGEMRWVRAPVLPLVWFLNSIIVAAVTSAGIVLLSGTAAYAFSRLRFKFRQNILDALLSLQMFPPVLTLVAYFSILELLGEYLPAFGVNTLGGLIAIYLAGISINIWMIKGYFDTIPASMEESARIDGASHFQTFIRVLLPISAPIFAVVFVLSFIYTMTEYPVASVVLQTPQNWTLAVGANSFLQEYEKLWGRFAALAVLSGFPITVIFLLCQGFVVGGLTSGGVKE